MLESETLNEHRPHELDCRLYVGCSDDLYFTPTKRKVKKIDIFVRCIQDNDLSYDMVYHHTSNFNVDFPSTSNQLIPCFAMFNGSTQTIYIWLFIFVEVTMMHHYVSIIKLDWYYKTHNKDNNMYPTWGLDQRHGVP